MKLFLVWLITFLLLEVCYYFLDKYIIGEYRPSTQCRIFSALLALYVSYVVVLC